MRPPQALVQTPSTANCAPPTTPMPDAITSVYRRSPLGTAFKSRRFTLVWALAPTSRLGHGAFYRWGPRFDTTKLRARTEVAPRCVDAPSASARANTQGQRPSEPAPQKCLELLGLERGASGGPRCPQNCRCNRARLGPQPRTSRLARGTRHVGPFIIFKRIGRELLLPRRAIKRVVRLW